MERNELKYVYVCLQVTVEAEMGSMFVVSVLTWRSTAPVWYYSPLSIFSCFSVGLLYAASLRMPSPSSPPPGTCGTRISTFSKDNIKSGDPRDIARGTQCTFDQAWIWYLYGEERLSAQDRVRSVQWQTWWSRSTAHSLWAWSLAGKKTQNWKISQIWYRGF